MQSWRTLRFDDHCGIKPRDVSFVGGSLSARLTRSKTLGSDRSVASRLIFTNAFCFIARREWLHEVWRVLCMAADFDRDYLLPSPTTNCNGCLPSELRCDTAYAMQNRVLYSLRKKGTLCLQESPRRSGFRIRLAHFAELHEGSWCAQGRTGLFGWMERARQRYELACRSSRHLEPSASRHTGITLPPEI